jgi:bifunctional non-homologous end joining protein LigD
MKCELSQNFLVGGFTDPQGKRVGLGALLVGHSKMAISFSREDRNRLRYETVAGPACATGQTRNTKAPFTKAVGLPRLRAHWVKPEIVVQVGFIEWTVHGKLRHPRLLALSKA